VSSPSSPQRRHAYVALGDAPRSRAETDRRTLLLAPAGFGKRTYLRDWSRRLRRQGWAVHWLGLDAPEPPRRPAERAAYFLEAATVAQLEALPSHWSTAPHPTRRVFVSSTHYPADLARFSAWRIVDGCQLALSTQDVAADASTGLDAARAGQLVHYTAGWPAAIAIFLQQWRGVAHTPDEFAQALAALPCRLKDAIERMLQHCSARARRLLAELALFPPLGIETASAICELDEFNAVWCDLRRLAPLLAIDADARIVLSPLLRDYANRFGARSAARSTRLLQRAAERRALDLPQTVRQLAARGDVGLAAGLVEQAGGLLLLVDHGVGPFGQLLRTLAPRFQPLQSVPLEHARRGFDVLCGNATPEALAPDARAHGTASDPAQRGLLHALLSLQRAEGEIRFDAPREIAALAADPGAAADPRERAFLLAIRIFFLQRHGPLAEAQQRVERIGALYRLHGFTGSAQWLTLYTARNAFAAGDLGRADALATRLLAAPAAASDPLLHSLAHYLVAACAFERTAFEQLAAPADGPDPAFGESMLFEADVARHVLPEVARAWRGNVLQAIARLDRVARHAGRQRRLLWALATAARLELLAVHLPFDRAQRLPLYEELESVWQECTTAAAVPWLVVEAVARARFLDECASPERAATAAETAACLFELATAAGYPLAIAGARVMQARVMLHARREPAAKRFLLQALETASRHGAWRLLLPLGRENLGLLRRVAGAKQSPFAEARRRLAQLLGKGNGAGQRLTPRELAIVHEVLAAKSSKAIARALRISPETVKSHLKAIFAKCGTRSRAELRAAFCARSATPACAAPEPPRTPDAIQLQVPGSALTYPLQDDGMSSPW